MNIECVVSNFFGRIAEIAKEFVTKGKSIQDFSEATVDKNSSKLVLAVSVYIQNDWFIMYLEKYAEIGEMIIFPIIELLEIDKKITDKQRTTKYDSRKRNFGNGQGLLAK